jgi:FkbM family methyltransferase
MRATVRGVLHKAYRRMRRSSGPPAITPPVWRAVERGPLAGLVFFLPGGRNAPWADRIRAGDYEPATLDVLTDLARGGGVLYDIGAHIGFYSCAWMRLGGARVEAFEPLPSTAQVLRRTLACNKLDEAVHIHNVALGDFAGPGRMMADESDLGAASAAYLREIGPPDLLHDLPGFTPGAGPTVAVHRLDDFVAAHDLPRPALLKLDVEGAEARIVAGASRLIATCRPALLCEVHTIDAGLALAHQLALAGYRLRILGKNGVQPACLWTPTERTP